MDEKAKVNASYYVTMGRYQKYTPKPINIADQNTALLLIWNDFHMSSLIRQSCHFERDVDNVLLQLVDILNTQFKYRDGS